MLAFFLYNRMKNVCICEIMQFSLTREITISIKQNTGMNIRAGIFSVQQKTLVISFRRKALYEYIKSSIFKAVIFFYYPQGSKFEQI